MARGYIPTVDPVHRRRLSFAGTTVVWSSGRAWAGLVLEKLGHEELDTPEFVIADHCVVLHVSQPATVEHKIHGTYRRFLHGPGNICLFSAGSARQLRSLEPHFVLVMTIAPRLVGHGLELQEHRDLRDGRIQHIVRGLELEAEEGYPSGALYGESLGLGLAIHLTQMYSTRPGPVRAFKGGMAPKTLRRVIDYIDANLKEDLRLSALSAVACLSEHRFAHNFKRATGLPPHRYVMSQKIARAERLLRESRLSVTQIGYALGFSHPSRFSFAFNRWMGITPTAFRNRER